MKYKFKTDYVYIYYTDDKGTQGKIAYKKGDIVDVFSPLGGNPFSGANVLVEVTPFKAYDVMNKAYKTIRKISIRTAFLEAVNEYQQGRPDVIDKGIKKYKITRDYDAPYLYDYDDGIRYITAPPTPSPTRKFYKGDIVDAITYQGKIVSSHYDITAVAEPYDDKKTENEPQPESKKSKIFTTNNILIGLAAIAVIGIGYYIIKK
jgi:hypothetical protein